MAQECVKEHMSPGYASQQEKKWDEQTDRQTDGQTDNGETRSRTDRWTNEQWRSDPCESASVHRYSILKQLPHLYREVKAEIF